MQKIYCDVLIVGASAAGLGSDLKNYERRLVC